MKAVVISRPGGPEVLEMQERPVPTPGLGEIRVKVHATALNRADVLQRLGRYPAPPGAPQDIPGLEFAGTVETFGDGLTRSDLAVGEPIFGLIGGGSYAEYLCVPAQTVAKMPKNLSFVEAAAIPEAYATAWDAMVTQGRLAAGETVLISAVGSGVGTAAVQIAQAIGATSIGTARSQDKLDQAGRLGLNHGLLPSTGDNQLDFAKRVLQLTDGRGVDLVLELVGGPYVPENVRCMALQGRIGLVGLLAGASAEVDLGVMLRKRIVMFGTVMRARPIEEKIAVAALLGKEIRALIELGRLKPVIDCVMPLNDVVAAHTRMESHAGLGKIVLQVC